MRGTALVVHQNVPEAQGEVCSKKKEETSFLF
jgi:hypothetical protein